MTVSHKDIKDPELQKVEAALIRAGKNALELGLRTNTPVYIWEDGKIVDLTKKKKQCVTDTPKTP